MKWIVVVAFVVSVLARATSAQQRIPEYAEEQCRRKGGVYHGNGDCEVAPNTRAADCRKHGGEYTGDGRCRIVPADAQQQCEKRGGVYAGDGHCVVPGR